MSPRPRKVTDDQLFAATHVVMSREGPQGVTLAAIAREAGVTAAVLVQRFGSKRALLLAIAKKHAEGAGEMMEELARHHRSPLAALRAYSDCMAGLAGSPAALARSLAGLQIDLTDPDFYRYLRRQAQATRAGLERMVTAAVKAGELVSSVNPARLARSIEALVAGSMLVSAFYQQGSAARWMRADLDALLAPYLPRQRDLRRNRR